MIVHVKGRLDATICRLAAVGAKTNQAPVYNAERGFARYARRENTGYRRSNAKHYAAFGQRMRRVCWWTTYRVQSALR